MLTAWDTACSHASQSEWMLEWLKTGHECTLQGNRLAEKGAVRAFRCQLPRANEFYSSDPPTARQSAPPPVSVSHQGCPAWLVLAPPPPGGGACQPLSPKLMLSQILGALLSECPYYSTLQRACMMSPPAVSTPCCPDLSDDQALSPCVGGNLHLRLLLHKPNRISK